VEIPRWARRTWSFLKVLLGASGVAIVSSLLKIPSLVVSFFQWAIIGPVTPQQTLKVSTVGQIIIIVALVAVVGLGLWLFDNWGKNSGLLLGEAGQLFDAIATRGSEYLVHDVQMHVEITDDLSIRGTSEYTVEALDSEVHAIAATRGSSDVACVGIDTVQFNARLVQGPGDLHTVVALNDPNQKKYLVFFDPPLKPSEKRRIRTSHCWPGSAKKTLGADDWDRNEWSWPPRCKAAVNSVTLSIRHPADGRRYETRASSQPTVGGETPTGWSGTFTNVVPGTGIALRTRRAP